MCLVPILRLSDREFKINVAVTIETPVRAVTHCRGWEPLAAGSSLRNQKEVLQYCNKMKTGFLGLSLDLKQLSKGSVKLKIGQ